MIVRLDVKEHQRFGIKSSSRCAMRWATYSPPSSTDSSILNTCAYRSEENGFERCTPERNGCTDRCGCSTLAITPAVQSLKAMLAKDCERLFPPELFSAAFRLDLINTSALGRSRPAADASREVAERW